MYHTQAQEAYRILSIMEEFLRSVRRISQEKEDEFAKEFVNVFAENGLTEDTIARARQQLSSM